MGTRNGTPTAGLELPDGFSVTTVRPNAAKRGRSAGPVRKAFEISLASLIDGTGPAEGEGHYLAKTVSAILNDDGTVKSSVEDQVSSLKSAIASAAQALKSGQRSPVTMNDDGTATVTFFAVPLVKRPRAAKATS